MQRGRNVAPFPVQTNDIRSSYVRRIFQGPTHLYGVQLQLVASSGRKLEVLDLAPYRVLHDCYNRLPDEKVSATIGP